MNGRAIGLAILLAAAANGAVLRVGPGRRYKHPCAPFNAGAVRDGDTVEIDSVTAAGDPIRYDLGGNYGDVMQCVIPQNGITIRGAGGQNPILNATGPAPNGKGIFNVKGDRFTVEHLTMQGATHPWCGSSCTPIRMEGDSLTVRWCVFRHNNMGLLHTPAGGEPGRKGHGGADLIEHSEFCENGTGGGQEHNVYINSADSLVFRFNVSRCPHGGHLLKSRSDESQVLYNLFQDDAGCAGADGQSSALLDFPMGGRIYLVGNIIAGGARTHPSPGMISIGGEILANYHLDKSAKGIYVVGNTIVNRNVNTLSPDTIFAFPGGPDLDNRGMPVPGSTSLPCRGDNRRDTANGFTRVPYPAGTTWLTEPPVVMNNVIWRYPNLDAWNGAPPRLGDFCSGFPIVGAGGAVLGPPVLGPGGRDTNWTNWHKDEASDGIRWRDPGFVQAPAARAATRFRYDDRPAPPAVIAEADSPSLDLRLRPDSVLIGKAAVPPDGPVPVRDGVGESRSLRPGLVYAHPRNYKQRRPAAGQDLGASEHDETGSPH